MIYSIIVAIAENGVMGRDGDLPWRLSSDLKLFRRLTMGKPIVMGRKTFQTLPGALDGRLNIVVSRDPDFSATDVKVVSSFEKACVEAENYASERKVDEIMIIGGAQIYMCALPVASRLYLTRVSAHIEGDTVFPEIDWSEWEQRHVERFSAGPKDEFNYSFHIYERELSM